MLQRIRDGLQGQKWLAWVVLGAIGATFIFWGGTNSLDFNGVSKRDAAKVNGKEISSSDATRAWSEEQAKWARQSSGAEIPADIRTKIQDSILERLVMQEVIDQELDGNHYRVSEASILNEIHSYNAFKDRDGNYDAVVAREFLRNNGISESELLDITRRTLRTNQVEQGLGDSNFLTRAESTRLGNLENEEREVQYVVLSADKFTGTQPVEDTAVKAYYDKNADRFMTTESASLEFAELRLEQLATQVTPTEADLKKVYDANRASYVSEEQRRSRHILIPIKNDDDAAALKKAQEVLAEARAGKDFGELAKKNSSDGSAAQGGELGFASRAQFVGPFSDALFGLKVGEIAGPVKSQFGYHIIQLEEIQAEQGKTFEQVHAEIDSQYRKDRAAELFGDRQEQISAAIEKGGTDLDALAKDLGLTRGSVAEFLKGGGAEPLGSSPDLQQAVFSDAALNQGKVGGPIALGEDRLVVFKVVGHKKAVVKPLAQVHDEIVSLLRQERGVTAAKAAADGAVAKLTGGEKLETLAGTWGVPVEPAHFVSRGDPSIPAALRTAVFDTPRPDAKPVYRTTVLDNGATAVYVITRTRVGDTSANPQLARQLSDSLRRRVGEGDVASWVDAAKNRAKIVKNPAVFE